MLCLHVLRFGDSVCYPKQREVTINNLLIDCQRFRAVAEFKCGPTASFDGNSLIGHKLFGGFWCSSFVDSLKTLPSLICWLVLPSSKFGGGSLAEERFQSRIRRFRKSGSADFCIVGLLVFGEDCCRSGTCFGVFSDNK